MQENDADANDSKEIGLITETVDAIQKCFGNWPGCIIFKIPLNHVFDESDIKRDQTKFVDEMLIVHFEPAIGHCWIDESVNTNDQARNEEGVAVLPALNFASTSLSEHVANVRIEVFGRCAKTLFHCPISSDAILFDHATRGVH